MGIIKRILVGGIWIALFIEVLLAIAIWTRTEVADYDVKAEHAVLTKKWLCLLSLLWRKIERGRR